MNLHLFSALRRGSSHIDNENRLLGSALVAICALALPADLGIGLRARGKNVSWAAAGPTSNLAGPAASLSKPDAARQGRILQGYGRLTLAFEANKGQTDARVKFLSRGAGYTLFLTGDEAVLLLRKAGVSSQKSEGRTENRKSKFETQPSFIHQSPLVSRQLDTGCPSPGHSPRPAIERNVERVAPSEPGEGVLRIALLGANTSAPIAGLDELPGKTNYFIGNDPRKWRTNVPTYAKVKYEDVYPGVDLVYYGNQGQLEYDFVVAPGVDPGVIKLALGTESAEIRNPKLETRQSSIVNPQPAIDAPLRIDPNGDLVVKIDTREVHFHRPVVYQPDAVAPASSPAGWSPVDGHYRLIGRNQVSFQIASFDPRRPLVIDPALSYSSYLGGSDIDAPYAIAVDASGDAYVAGYTGSTNFPTTAGAFQPALAGMFDAFVTKLDAAGSSVVYSTYVGGHLDDVPFGIAVDASGDAYVTGQTYSDDFPTTAGAFQQSCGGLSDGWVIELNPSGSALVYSTYLGGSNQDHGDGIALDASGDAYITGYTWSLNFPTTPGAFQSSLGGDLDAFVTELNPAGSALVYSTYLGGSGHDHGDGIVLDTAGDAYVAGFTDSSDFPTTPGAFQTACNNCDPSNGIGDAFVTKLDPTGSALLYSTYLGGSLGAYGSAVAIDASGNAYVTGNTDSSDFPTTSGAFQTSFGGKLDAFVTELNSTGSALVYSTYLGGNGSDSSSLYGNAIALDALGNAYVTGFTISSNFPVTPGAFQTALPLSSSATFVTELDPTGSALVYSTLLAGSAGSFGIGVTLDGAGNAYVTGSTTSTDFPTTPGSFQVALGGATDAFVTKFTAGDQVWPLSLSFGNQGVGTTSTAQLTTLSNSGTTTLNITGIAISGANSGDFAETSTCGTSLAAGATCTISVTFTPTATGTRTASVSITDDAPNSPQLVSLTGVGTQSAVTLSPTKLTFATQLVGTSSKAQNVTLTNTGNGTLNITSITTSGDFTQTNTCGSSVAPGATCTISVTFTPSTKGTRTGTLSVTDDAPGSPQTVSLTGAGTFVKLSPTGLNFGSVPVGQSSSKNITLTNTATVTLSITSISITGTNTGDFSQTNTCGTSVAAGASCTITATFTPTATGTRSANVSISDNGGGSPQKVGLLGTGT